MDKKSLTGLLLIGAILVGWMYFAAPSKKELAHRKHIHDSIESAQAKIAKEKAIRLTQQQHKDSIQSVVDTASQHETAVSDSVRRAQETQKRFGPFAKDSKGTNKTITIENSLMKIHISTLGGRISSVQLKKYKTSSGKPLILFNPDSSQFNLSFTGLSRFFTTDSLFFTPVGNSFTVSGKDSNKIAMRAYAGDPGKYIEFVYTLKGNSYMMGFTINTVGMQKIIAANTDNMTIDWRMKTPTQEKTLKMQRMVSTVYYKYAQDEVDYISPRKNEKKELDANIRWVGFKQQFFTSDLIADSYFAKPTDISSHTDKGSKKYVKAFTASITIPYDHHAKESFPMHFYFGPNHYPTLKKFGGLQLERQIYLGWGIFGWVNRFLVIPLFNFLSSFHMNYGLVILILTLIIKALLFPVAYKTYMSSAKMRVLKPEIDEINAKYKDDSMKKQQATMALYKKAGVNPLAGCVPMLLQMPILFALFEFFPSSIELRQQSFLWAHDLSTYDSIAHLPFNIPFYGDHVSLFTLLMTASTLLYTYTNNQMMGTNNQMPQMKWIMYLMPIMFLGFLNNYSSGLSYYYFLANLMTFGQMTLIKRFVDEDALHKKLQANKAKPAKASKFQKRLEEMAKQQQQMQQQKNKKKKK